MNPYPQPVLFFTRDEDLAAWFRPLLSHSMELRIPATWEDFRREAMRIGPCVVLLDVRFDRHTPEPEVLLREFPDHLFIAVGIPRSTPMHTPAVASMFAAEDAASPPSHLLLIVEIAQRHLDLQAENRRLREAAAPRQPPQPPVPPPSPREELFSARNLIRILRSMDHLESFQEQLLEELAVGLKLSRAGILLTDADSRHYRIRAGRTLLPGSESTGFDFGDPFVLWLERNPHTVSRETLPALGATGDEQIMLRRVLDRLGAEVLLPLRGRGGLLGMFFCGRPLNGLPLDAEFTDQLLLAADLMAVSIERALLYREVQIQKSFAETLVNGLPIGVVYADAESRIRWCSPRVEEILALPPGNRTGRPIHELGEAVARAAAELSPGTDIRDPVTGHPLRLTAVAVPSGDTAPGVLVTLEDRTRENALKERQDRLERATFWTQLAASMSHEVRNPLVAINTFAQLLPERYQDEEFREEFSHMVGAEIKKLGGMIDQINAFAHPPELELRPVDLRPLIQQAAENARVPGGPEVFERIAPALPRVAGDAQALQESLDHLLRNSREALENRHGEIMIRAGDIRDPDGTCLVEIELHDNGPGIPDDLRHDVFSPFRTSKAKGLGLGLAIAQRTVQDHNGTLEVASTPRGTTVRIRLPACTPGDTT